MSGEEIRQMWSAQGPYVFGAYAVVVGLIWGYAAWLWMSHRAANKRAAAHK